MARERAIKKQKTSQPDPAATPASAGPSQAGTSQGSQRQGIKISAEELKYVADKVKHYSNEVSNSGLTEQSLKECACQVTRHMLAANHKDPHKPVPRRELIAVVKKLAGSSAKTNAAVITKAQSDLTAFGFEMVQLAQGQQQCYVLRSLLPRSFIKKYVHSPQASAMDALAVICLTFLELKGDKCHEDELWAYLNKFGLYGERDQAADHAGSHIHPAFGMLPSAALASLVSQKILVAEKQNLGGDMVIVYMAGDAAVGPAAELNKAQTKAAIEQLVPMRH